MQGRSDGALRVIEAAYDLTSDEPEWLERMLGELAPFGFDDGYAYAVVGGRIESLVRASPVEVEGLDGVHKLPPEVFDALHLPSPPVERAANRWRRVAEAQGIPRSEIEGQGFKPSRLTALLATDAGARGAMFVARDHVGIAPRTKRLLASAGAHVAAAARLRAFLRSRSAETEAEAIYSPSGRLLHARDHLADWSSIALAVKDIDRARGKLRRLSPDESVAAWRALVDGRWSLVDHVERDGKRFVLAHRNEAPSTIASLATREAQVASLAALAHSDKYIGYELGIERSTVATHLRRALRKLRLRDRASLVHVFGPLARVRVSSEATEAGGTRRRSSN